MGTMVLGLIQGMRLSRVCPWQGRTVADMTDIQAKIQQIAAVLGQLEDTQVPRNIRNSVKDAVEKWLLNDSKDMDVRLGMTASMLDEIFNDANLPIHYGPLCLQIQTALEGLLNQVRDA